MARQYCFNQIFFDMLTTAQIDLMVQTIMSVILKNRHSLTEEEVSDLNEIVFLLEEYRERVETTGHLSLQMLEKVFEILIRSLLEETLLNKIKDLLS